MHKSKTKAKNRALPRNNTDRPRGATFSLNQVLGDFAAAYHLLGAGQLNKHAGQMVAVLGGKVVGTGPDATFLRMAVSQAHRVHPERIAVIRVVDETMAH
jgi:hypothetical protein